MKETNIIIEKTFGFGLCIIKLHLYLKEKKVDRALALQLLRSGTSIGDNVEEAMGGYSRKDFIQNCVLLIVKQGKLIIGSNF